MGKINKGTFEGLMSVMAQELGLTDENDIKSYIDVTLAVQDGYPNDGKFNFTRTGKRAESDYNVDLTIHRLRKRIERTKIGRKLLKELGTEVYAIPVPDLGHRVFDLPAENEGYRWILEKIKGGGKRERLG